MSQADTETLHAYDHEAAEFAEDWHTQPTPSDMYALVREFFTPGPTADIGCGSGRDTDRLLRDEELVSVSSGKKVHRIIARQD